MSYCTAAYADEYLSPTAFASGWESLDAETKGKYLESASRIIRRFCYFYDDTDMPFRYALDASESDIPDFLREATCEEALYLVNLGKDPTQADKKTTLGILSTDGTVFDKSFAADVLCVIAQNIIVENGGEIASGATGTRIGFGRIEK